MLFHFPAIISGFKQAEFFLLSILYFSSANDASNGCPKNAPASNTRCSSGAPALSASRQAYDVLPVCRSNRHMLVNPRGA
jgi:hypothetical protein